jgi:hypothetical protein
LQPVTFNLKHATFNLSNPKSAMPLLSDTSPDAAEMMIRGYREMKPGRKMILAGAMSRAVMQLAAARIRKAHSGITDRELLLRLASLWLDRETLIRAFGWDPLKEGY